MSDLESCRCPVCQYSGQIHSLAMRQKTADDLKAVNDLYERFAMAEDDNSLYRGRWRDIKPVLHLIRKDHFETNNPEIRLKGHEECALCILLERVQ